MMKAILSVIVKALRSLAGFARRAAAAPFVAMAHLFGGGSDQAVVPEVAAPVVDQDETTPGLDMDAVYRELAIAARTWAANSIVAGQPLPMPPQFPRGLSEWLRGISVDEAHAIINASESQVFAHTRSRELIDGLCSVRPLEPAIWPEPEAEFDLGSAEFTCDAGYVHAR